MKNESLKYFVAFTLAEVLIVLGIIGIVAAMTIPTLMNKIQQQEFVSGLKKSYSILYQAFSSLCNEYGGDFSDVIAAQNGDTAFKSKLKYIKYCPKNNDDYKNECFPYDDKIKLLNNYTSNQQKYTNGGTGRGFILQDGISLSFNLWRGDPCKRADTMNRDDRCGWIVVDVNGLKKPNQWGKDIYMFMVFAKTILPAKAPLDAAPEDDCISGGEGFTCASKFINE